MVTAPDRRVMVRWMQTKGLSQRRALEVIRMSATVLRYQPRPDRNTELRTSIVELAQRHRRYGVGMIYLKLRQRGQCVNYKRVERLYRLEKLQVQRRRRKKRDLTERHPLGRPSRRNEVWSVQPALIGPVLKLVYAACLPVIEMIRGLGAIAESAVRSNSVVVTSPLFDQHLCFT